jgi:hypothetical protein
MSQLVIVKKLRWYHRLWHKILTWAGRECYACEVLEIQNWRLELDRMWLCPGCWEYKSWDCGCAHEDPQESRLCDDCWVAAKEAVHE